MIIIDGCVKFNLCYNNSFKKISFEDNVYFTLRDINWNIHWDKNSYDNLSKSIFFFEKLSEINFKERTNDFCYTNILNDKQYVLQLIQWLNSLHPSNFDLDHSLPSFDTEEQEIEYFSLFLSFFDWWEQFKNLKFLLNTRLTELNKVEELIRIEPVKIKKKFCC